MSDELEKVTEEKVLDYLKSFGFSDKATDLEQRRFIGIARELQLNPFKREIYLVVYGNGESRTCSIITGYEVYLKRASRLNILDGWRAWIEGDGESMKAVCEIRRRDWREPFTWETYYKEAVQHKKDGSVTRPWLQQPRFMLKKVATAQAFRLCFPDEMGSMPYIGEEIEPEEQERNITPPEREMPEAVNEKVEPARKQIIDHLHALVDSGTIDKATARDWEQKANKAALNPAIAAALAELAEIMEELPSVHTNDREGLDAAADKAFRDPSDEPPIEQELF